MARLFRFRGAAETLDVGQAIAASRSLSRLRDSLEARHGPRGVEIVEDMVVVVMRRAGDHYTAVRGAQIDKIMSIRTRIDGAYSRLMRDEPSDDLDVELRRIADDYAELDAAIADAAQPVEGFRLLPSEQDAMRDRFRQELLDPDGTQSGRFLEQDTQSGGRPIEEDFLDSQGRLPGQVGYAPSSSRAHRKGWREDPDAPGSFTNTFEDGSSARIRVEEVDGRGIYVLTSRQRDGTELSIREESILADPYGRKPRTTSVLNAHHGVQAAPMEARFGSFGYDRHAAPTIWLRNSRAGSPHGRITAIEGRTGAHASGPGSKLTDAEIAGATYEQMRRTAEREMRSVGVSERAIRAYLAAHDAYFRQNVFPNIPKHLHHAMLGGWRPIPLDVPQ